MRRKRRCCVFLMPVVLLLTMSLQKSLTADQKDAEKSSKAEVIQKIKKLQIPFIANEGQIDERVTFYANTFTGSVFVTKDGEIVYSLPSPSPDPSHQGRGMCSEHVCGVRANGRLPMQDLEHGPRVNKDGLLSASEILDLFLISCSNPISKIISPNLDYPILQSENRNPKSKTKAVALKEELVGGEIAGVKGEGKSITKVSYFKGNDPAKWKNNISTYDLVDLKEVYTGIDLKLRAYGDNVEKLFTVKPGADPDQIKIRLSGVNPHEFSLNKGGERGLLVNEQGELEVETELGTVKFTKPVAYQMISGKRVDVEVEYSIQNPEFRRQKQELPNQKSVNNNRTRTNKFVHATPMRNPKSAVRNPKSEYGFKVAAYDKTKDLIIDPLLASTYLGGSSEEGAVSIAIDSNGNIYVTGDTGSSDFPITTGAYDTSFNSGTTDIFVSKLNGNLTSLLASTYLGGSDFDEAFSIAIDSNGNIYVTGRTGSSDFPITTGAYDTSFNSVAGYVYEDVFVSKLNGTLTNLLASTYLGGSFSDLAQSIAIDSHGNIYVTGFTFSSDFPITTGAYDTSYSCGDVFISKLDSSLSGATAVTLASFTAVADDDGNVTLAWETATEIDNAGFNLYRSRHKNGTYTRINNALINAKGNAVSGASYSYVDTPGRDGTYYYKLEDVDYNGGSTMHGHEKVRVIRE